MLSYLFVQLKLYATPVKAENPSINWMSVWGIPISIHRKWNSITLPYYNVHTKYIDGIGTKNAKYQKWILRASVFLEGQQTYLGKLLCLLTES